MKVHERPCLVVGGGEVALRKIELLVGAGAHVTVVAPEVHAATAAFCEQHGVAVVRRRVREEDLDDRLLVIAATGDRAVNDSIRRGCLARNTLLNCVDDGAGSTALFPAIVDRGAVTVAISTGGASPTLARRLRERIESVMPSTLGALASFLGDRRERVRQALAQVVDRRHFWDRVLDGKLPDLVAAGDVRAADALLDAELRGHGQAVGFVSLVGAGPGDADLLTLKALSSLQRADVVLHDNLVSADVLARCRRDARKVYVGKRRSFADTRQQAINAMLVDEARAGRRVVRLKGGDPFIFGRGGEEIETLAAEGIPFEVVPGITAALGCAAYAGIPLTHRDWAQSVRFVTGHRSGGEFNLDWPELARPDQTLVIYMGLAGLSELCANLVEHGADPATPAAVVSRGTLPEQRVLVTTVGELAVSVDDRVRAPTTTIVGRVAQLGRSDLGD